MDEPPYSAMAGWTPEPKRMRSILWAEARHSVAEIHHFASTFLDNRVSSCADILAKQTAAPGEPVPAPVFCVNRHLFAGGRFVDCPENVGPATIRQNRRRVAPVPKYFWLSVPSLEGPGWILENPGKVRFGQNQSGSGRFLALFLTSRGDSDTSSTRKSIAANPKKPITTLPRPPIPCLGHMYHPPPPDPLSSTHRQSRIGGLTRSRSVMR